MKLTRKRPSQWCLVSNNLDMFVYNKPFTLVTDHKSLLWFKKADCNTRIQRWRFALSEYEYEIVHKSGKKFVNANSLSSNVPGTYSEAEVRAVTRSQRKKESQNQNDSDTNVQTKSCNKGKSSLINNKTNNISSSSQKMKKPSNTLSDQPSKKALKPKRGRPPKRKDNASKISSNESINQKGKNNRTKKKDSFQEGNEATEPIHPKKRKAREKEKESQTDEEEVPESPQSSSSSEEEILPEFDEETKTTRTILKNVNFSKESLRYMKDNKAYFIDPNGNPLDEGSKLIFGKNKIEKLTDFNPNTIYEISVDRKTHFIIVLENNESII